MHGASVASFDLKSYDDKVTVKSSSKNLIAKVTRENRYYNQNSYSDTTTIEDNGDVAVVAVAKKNGKYTVTITEKTVKGKLVASKKLTVYVNNDSPLKSITLNGKNLLGKIVTLSSGKIKVKMNKGYKLKKIEYGYYDKKQNQGEMVWKTVKNGKKITLGKYAYMSVYKSESGDKNSDYYYL